MSFEVVEFENSADANRKVIEILKNTRSRSTLTPVTFITPSYRTGNRLINQFTRGLVFDEGLALASIEQITSTDLLAKLAQHLNIMWSFSDYSRNLAQATSRKLYKDEQFGSADKLMPSTVLAISESVARFNWIDLEDDKLFKALSQSWLTPTSKLLINFARDIQAELNKTGSKTPANLLNQLVGSASELKSAGVSEILGRVIQIDESLPEFLSVFLDSILPAEMFTSLRAADKSTSTEIQESTLNSFSDVFTEVRHAVKQAIDYLNASGSALEVAILYSDSQDYATSLMSALDNAGIQWHGPAKDLAANSRIAILVKDILEYAASSQDSFLDRKIVMRAIRSRILVNPPGLPEEFSWYKVERYIKSTGLFNNAEAWLPELKKYVNSLPDLLKDLEEAEKYPGEIEVLDVAKEKVDNAYSSKALVELIEAIASFKKVVNTGGNAISELKASEALRNLLEVLIGKNSDRKLPVLDDKALAIILEALNLGFGDQEELGQNHGRALLSRVAAALNSKGANKVGGGLFIGDLNQPAATMYKYLIVLGCSEGAMPKRIQEDPLIPDALKRELPSGLANVLPDTNRSITNTISNIKSVIRGASNVALSFTRDGLVGAGSGKVSPLVNEITSTPVVEVLSFESYVDSETNAVLNSDLNRKANLQNSVSSAGTTTEIPELASALSLHSAQFTEYIGNLGPGTNAFSVETSILSPSAVETYLKCPHKFLVSYGLGFKFEDETDEIEDYRANDFGTMAHAAWEELFNECVKKGTIPTAGEPFSLEDSNRFKEIFQAQVKASKNKGQAGWEPLFDERANQLLANVDKYFELEHQHRSMTVQEIDGKTALLPLREVFKLRPHLAEYSFDQDGLFYLNIDVPANNGTLQMKFKGRMDRLDLSANVVAAGILDFKTTASSRILSNASEYIQDLLYSHAMRNDKAFPSIRLVTFNYLTMRDEKESDLISLREVPWRIYTDESNGGLPVAELPKAIEDLNTLMDAELKQKLSKLAIAIEQGKFEPNPKSKSADYCEVCKALGKSKANRVALAANPVVENEI
jgi:PD-(D/E)XK nuclease superfamily